MTEPSAAIPEAPVKPQRIPEALWGFMSASDRERVAHLSEQIANTRASIHGRLQLQEEMAETMNLLDKVFAPITGGTKTDIVRAEEAELKIRLWESELNEMLWRITHEFNQQRLAEERERNDRQLDAERSAREAQERIAAEQREADRREAAKLRKIDRARADKNQAVDTALAVRNVEANETAIAKADRNAKWANRMALLALLVAILTFLLKK